MNEYAIAFSYGKYPCLHIINSHLLKKGRHIKAELEYIHTLDGYKELQAAGYTRTLKSEYREWKAHNFLYRLGIARSRTGTTDIAQHESKWRRFCYAILSIF